MKTFFKNLWTLIVLVFQYIYQILDRITIRKIVELLKLDKLYLFFRDASLLDLIMIFIVLFGLYWVWKFIYMILYVFQQWSNQKAQQF